MSYAKAMAHCHNHRKDRFYQQCGGPAQDAFKEESNPIPYVDALDVLDQIDKYRRNCRFNPEITLDFALRYACNIIAKAAGYASRVDWLDAIEAPHEDVPQEAGKAVALTVLESIDSWRKKHLLKDTVDYALRYAEAVVASNAGFENRMVWTSLLKQDEKTAYCKDYNDPEFPTWVW